MVTLPTHHVRRCDKVATSRRKVQSTGLEKEQSQSARIEKHLPSGDEKCKSDRLTIDLFLVQQI